MERNDRVPIRTTAPPIGLSSGDRKSKRGINETLITNPRVPFQYQEAFHFLRTNIKFLSTEKDNRKIVVTSSIPSEGKTNISMNLAFSLSTANNTVVLIDADLRKPMLHRYLEIPNGTSMGLTNILHGMDNVQDCLRRHVSKKQMYVLPCGVIPPNPTDILGSPRMGELIEALSKDFDYVIIDTPPVSVVTDAAVLSQFVDGVLLVVRQKTVTHEAAQRAKKNLEAVNANILGVVLNDFNMKHLDKDSGYYYSYYYSDKPR